MKQRAQELKAEARRGSRAKKADGEVDVLAKIAEMPERDRTMAERLHAIIKATAPALSPKPGTGCPRTPKKTMSFASFKVRTSSRRDTRPSASPIRRGLTEEPCGRSPSR